MPYEHYALMVSPAYPSLRPCEESNLLANHRLIHGSFLSFSLVERETTKSRCSCTGRLNRANKLVQSLSTEQNRVSFCFVLPRLHMQLSKVFHPGNTPKLHSDAIATRLHTDHPKQIQLGPVSRFIFQPHPFSTQLRPRKKQSQWLQLSR
jgi:hypothetical protein